MLCGTHYRVDHVINSSNLAFLLIIIALKIPLPICIKTAVTLTIKIIFLFIKEARSGEVTSDCFTVSKTASSMILIYTCLLKSYELKASDL